MGVEAADSKMPWFALLELHIASTSGGAACNRHFWLLNVDLAAGPRPSL